ncbi:addiction module antidote protein [Magnetospirillum moscoviense]|uniref:Addiction module antitoxin n=1 Tax=Magnetospirillum moscoviense TaxID=1437059 RepID=A0A178MK49_9PROT|nr:addiction module antidote protein [Magnetospirillum moscoviense]OAN48415.1 addiction module antitoxin [Magnetospirillum moscoviense]
MSTTATRPWDITENLNSDERIVAYLNAALEEGDAALVVTALGDIARAKGMTEIAHQTGLGRESLHKALSPEGNPEFSTILKVVRALGLKLHASTEHHPA